MNASYVPYTPDQDLLLPPSLQEWLPEGHLAYFISDTVDALDLSAFHARYASGGPRNQPFHPAMMVKVLLYGYATGTFSSRKLARGLHENVALRVLGAGNFPAHRTLSDFRANHLEALSELFVQIVRLARECGLVKLGTVAIDGTKVKANASRHKAMSDKRMLESEQKLREQALADAGYRDEAVFAALADGETELIVSIGREGRDPGKIDATKTPFTAAMAERLDSEQGRTAYRRRQGIVEPPNGWIKHVMGFRQFSFRGVAKVRAEWKLVNGALNLRRMAYL